MSGGGEYHVYLGAYTGTESAADGIRLAFADMAGRLRCTDRVAETFDPSYLAVSPDGSTLYAVNETTQGRVVAFTVHGDGTLEEINSQPTLGAAPCHLTVHPEGNFLLTANYLTGDLVVHPIYGDGGLREACHVVQHSGHGADPCRQAGPHVHQVLTDPDGRHVLAVDLGTDSVYVYAFDAGTGHLTLREEVAMRAGAGPRHLAFHPSGTRLYLINELASTMTEFGYDPETGMLESGRTLSTLPADYEGRSLAAEVVISADGRFVYGSNRGHDSIAIFRAGTGEDAFRLVGIRPAGVAGPRHIALSPDGRILFVAGQKSNTVRAFTVEDSGTLAPTGHPVSTPSPVCVLPL
jgi:6-phosphogluconolactonase